MWGNLKWNKELKVKHRVEIIQGEFSISSAEETV